LIYSSTNADKIAAEITASNYVKAAAYQCNVTSQQEVESTLQKITSDFGKLDVVVVNSGVANHGPAENCMPEDWSKLMNVNLDGAFYTAQAAGRIFKTQGFGNIIFTASVSAVLVNTPQKQAAYNASKAAVVHLAKSLAVEWVDFCRVNCISPGYIATDMLDDVPQDWKDKWHQDVPARRLCAPYELKGVSLSLAVLDLPLNWFVSNHRS
jgi:sorbose reductase